MRNFLHLITKNELKTKRFLDQQQVIALKKTLSTAQLSPPKITCVKIAQNRFCPTCLKHE